MRNNHNNRKTDGQNKGVIVKESYSQNLIGTINNAVRQDKLLTIIYYSKEKGLTERVLEPMDIVIRGGRKNLVGWCRLRNDWRTFRIDRINFIKVHMDEKFEPREDYRRENFEDEGSNYSATVQNADRGDHRDRDRDRGSRPANKDLGFSTDNIKTMSENKLNFSNDNVKEYSEDEDDLAL